MRGIQNPPTSGGASYDIDGEPKGSFKNTSGKQRPLKVIVIGDSGVGKTCLTFRFCSGHFPSSATEATIGVDFR